MLRSRLGQTTCVLNKTKLITKSKGDSTAGPVCLSLFRVPSLELLLFFWSDKPTSKLSQEDPKEIIISYVWDDLKTQSQNPLIPNVQVTDDLHTNHLHSAHRKCLLSPQTSGVNVWSNWLRNSEHPKPFLGPGGRGSPLRLKSPITWHTGYTFATAAGSFSFEYF